MQVAKIISSIMFVGCFGVVAVIMAVGYGSNLAIAADKSGVQSEITSTIAEQPAYSLSANNWVTITGTLKQLSMGCDYYRSWAEKRLPPIWGVNSNNQVYQWANEAWELVDGSLSQISVGENVDGQKEIWGVNTNNQIYRRENESWQLVEGELKQTSIGCDGDIWGITPENKVQHRSGSGWQEVDGSLAQISVGNAENIWGISENHELFRRQNGSWIKVAENVSAVEADQKGEVWITTDSGHILRWARDRWMAVPGVMKQIAVTSNDYSVLVWAIDETGQIFQLESAHINAGYAYYDKNNNFLRDVDESGIPGFSIKQFWPGNSEGTVVTLSANDGFFYYEHYYCLGAPKCTSYSAVPPEQYPFITQSGPDYGVYEGLKIWLPVIQK